MTSLSALLLAGFALVQPEPPRERFFVLGKVAKGGVYTLWPKLTVREALERAGGPLDKDCKPRITVRPADGKDKTRDRTVGATEVVKAGDILIVNCEGK